MNNSMFSSCSAGKRTLVVDTIERQVKKHTAGGTEDTKTMLWETTESYRSKRADYLLAATPVGVSNETGYQSLEQNPPRTLHQQRTDGLFCTTKTSRIERQKNNSDSLDLTGRCACVSWGGKSTKAHTHTHTQTATERKRTKKVPLNGF